MSITGIQLVTAPTATPVSLADIKSHLGITGSYTDQRLSTYLQAAVNLIENETNLCLCTQSWMETYERFPHHQSIETRRAPIQSITSLQYYDATNTQQTLTSGTDFYLQTYYKAPAVLTPATSSSDPFIPDWPTEWRPRPDCIQLTYVAGWTTTSNVWSGPEMAVHAIKLLVTYWNDGNRGSNDLDIPCGFDRILSSLRFGSYR